MGSPLHRSRDDRRQLLTRRCIDVIAPMLAAGEAYADISVERIIRGADVSRSTFYRYFTDKPALLQAMATDVTQDLAEAGAQWFDLPVPPSRDGLQEGLHALFTTYRRHHLILRSITDAAAYDPGMRVQYAALVARATEGLRAHVAGLTELRPRLAEQATSTAGWLVWMLERGLYQRVAEAGETDVAAELDTLVELLWNTLYAAR